MAWQWLALAAAGFSAGVAGQADSAGKVERPPSDIVVTGKRLADVEAQLAACIARQCPPNQEIAATLAVAQMRFETGDYKAARAALVEARARNARHAKRYPVSVANLHHANGVVARHLGLANDEKSSAIGAIASLKAGLTEDDPRVLLARIELADTYARAGQFAAAATELARVADDARRMQLDKVEGTARLKRATLFTQLSAADSTYLAPATEAIAAIVERSEPAFAKYADAARRLQVQLAAQAGRTDELEQLIAAYPPQPEGGRPILLYAPTVQLRRMPSAADVEVDPTQISTVDTSLSQGAMESYDGQWIDVAYTIGRDGRVADPVVAKQPPGLRQDWVDRVLTAIAKRRYARQADESRGLERFTFTSNWIRQTGSRLAVRDPIARLESMVLQ